MSRKIFVSYNHQQGKWVWNSLVPVLKAGGVEILIDKERFEPGKAILGQMDETQDTADMSVLVLSPNYLESDYCIHEMDRAIACDPDFQRGLVIPVKRLYCSLPPEVKRLNPLYIDLCDDKDKDQWGILLKACKADLGAEVPHWISVRDRIRWYLQRKQSVNLIVYGKPEWRGLIDHLCDDYVHDLGVVDLQAVPSRPALVEEILKVCCGSSPAIPLRPEGEDLVILKRMLSARSVSRLALLHFDLASLDYRPHYGIDLFATLRYLTTDSRKLVLLVQSRIPFPQLLPENHPLSDITVETVELRGS